MLNLKIYGSFKLTMPFNYFQFLSEKCEPIPNGFVLFIITQKQCMQTHSCLICKHHTVLTFSKLTARIKKTKTKNWKLPVLLLSLPAKSKLFLEKSLRQTQILSRYTNGINFKILHYCFTQITAFTNLGDYATHLAGWRQYDISL